MLQGIEGIMNLAAASGEELGKTSDIVTDALTALGMSAEESGRLADILAAAATNSNTNVAMMGDSFKYAATTAGLLGYSAEDVAVALGLMANSGIKADMAGTSLRNMFNRMAKPTKESAEAMERLGLSLYDDEGQMYSLRQIMDQLRQSFTEINMPLDEYNMRLDEMDGLLAAGDITQKQYEKSLKELNLQAFGAEGAEKARAAAMLGGTRAMAGLAAIANASTEDYEQLTKAIDGSSDAFAKLADGSVVPLNEALASGQEIIEQYNGAAEAMAMTMQDNLNGQLTILKSQLQELAISLGDLLMPMIREFVSKIQDIVTWLNSLDDAQKEQIMQIAAIVAAVGPALLLIGKVVNETFIKNIP
jgi:phage-related minor tail protein